MSTITTKDSTEIYYKDYRRLLAPFRDSNLRGAGISVLGLA